MIDASTPCTCTTLGCDASPPATFVQIGQTYGRYGSPDECDGGVSVEYTLYQCTRCGQPWVCIEDGEFGMRGRFLHRLDLARSAPTIL